MDVATVLLSVQVLLAVAATVIAIRGFFVVPRTGRVPIHAGFDGFDEDAPRTPGLLILAVLPIVMCGVFIAVALSQESMSVAGHAMGVATMVVLVIFNAKAVEAARRKHP